MEATALYLADDDPARLAGLERSARPLGVSTTLVRTGEQLAACLEQDAPGVLLLEAGFEEAAELVSARGPRLLQIVVVSTTERPPPRPLREAAAEELRGSLDEAALEAAWTRAVRRLALAAGREGPSAGRTPGVGPLEAGSGTVARRLQEQVERVAGAADTTVLLVGPRGAGKQAVGRAIHRRSRRSAGAFLVIRCTRPEEELVGALFGDALVPGGALAAPIGGTLFLEQVTGLTGGLQERLAETLSARAAAGEHQGRAARLIAATERSLADEVTARRFREELFYRLNVLSVSVPALALAREDIPLLARTCLAALAGDDRRSPTLSDAAARRLQEHSWPGNQRELCAVIERAALLAGPAPILPCHLGLEDLEPATPGQTPSLPLEDRSLRALEEALIRRVLAEEQHNRSRVARILGINRTTLYNKLKLYGID